MLQTLLLSTLLAPSLLAMPNDPVQEAQKNTKNSPSFQIKKEDGEAENPNFQQLQTQPIVQNATIASVSTLLENAQTATAHFCAGLRYIAYGGGGVGREAVVSGISQLLKELTEQNNLNSTPGYPYQQGLIPTPTQLNKMRSKNQLNTIYSP